MKTLLKIGVSYIGQLKLINLVENKMKYVALFFVILLQGCMWQSVNQSDIQTAIKACNGVENIVEIEAHAVGAELAMCSNREVYRLNQEVWNRK